jgi:cation:H+ antiporter
MVWVEFLVSAALITYASTQLARFGDVIALRTRLGRLFIGTLMIAAVTSLPEVLTTISALFQGIPNLAAGNLFGSNMFNMVLLAFLDLAHYKQRLLRRAAMRHALSGSLTVFLIGLAVFFLVARLPLHIGWVGVDSIVMLLAYFVAMRLIEGQSRQQIGGGDADELLPEGLPGMRTALIGFSLASAALIVITPWMVSTSARIAEITGLGTTFIGATLVAAVTSLPEVVTTFAAARIGADDMAIGNLFGSNLFNMAALGLGDLFYLQGLLFSAIDPSFVLVGLLGLIMTGLGLIGNLARLERRLLFVELDALALILTYFGGMVLLYLRGGSP